MKLYHNPRCQKSREALKLLQDKGLNPELVLYMTDSLTPDELEKLIQKLGIGALELIRTKEKVWKENFADKELAEDELILTMLENPQLIERPILEVGDEAKIGRPPELILELVN
jgi:arsenate reductase